MAEVCFAAAMSHTAQLHRSRDALPEHQDKEIYGAIDQLKQSLIEAQLDVLIVLYGDHYSYFNPKNMPAFSIGICDEYQTFGDAGIPKFTLPGNKELSLKLTNDLMAQGFDMAWSNALSPDHGLASPFCLMDILDLPIIPIRVNSIAPPLISMQRAHQFGQGIRKIVENWDMPLRIGLLGTGGLSHFLPLPDPFNPQNDEEIQMVNLITEGNDPQQLSQLIIKRVNEVRQSNQGDASINVQFDDFFIEHLKQGHLSPLLSLTTEDIAKQAGNGGQEIRNWVAVSGFVADKGIKFLSYEPAAPWLTGIATAEFHLQ